MVAVEHHTTAQHTCRVPEGAISIIVHRTHPQPYTSIVGGRGDFKAFKTIKPSCFTFSQFGISREQINWFTFNQINETTNDRPTICAATMTKYISINAPAIYICILYVIVIVIATLCVYVYTQLTWRLVMLMLAWAHWAHTTPTHIWRTIDVLSSSVATRPAISPLGRWNSQAATPIYSILLLFPYCGCYIIIHIMGSIFRRREAVWTFRWFRYVPFELHFFGPTNCRAIEIIDGEQFDSLKIKWKKMQIQKLISMSFDRFWVCVRHLRFVRL